ncbi:arabinose isomerase [candidate division KSB1 bacterium]|nr:arabinose isomerase [candidate division KSB1 bacterium]
MLNSLSAQASQKVNSSTNQASEFDDQLADSGNKIRVGLYGIGLDTYWSQFEGLYDRLQTYQQTIANRLSENHKDIDVINTGIVDNPEKAREVGAFLAQQNLDAIFLYISTYALSSTVLPVVQQLKIPVIVLSIQPTKAIDYKSFNALGDRGKMTGEWLAYCQACSAPEIACVFNRSQIDYHLITGTLDDEATWNEIDDWMVAIKVAAMMRDTRIGVLGHYYGGMLDVYSDMTQLASTFGCHFEILEMSDLYNCSNKTTEDQTTGMINQFNHDFAIDPQCDKQELTRAARTAVALESLVDERKLGCMAYYYDGSGDQNYLDIITSIIPGNTLLTMHGVPVAGEYEIKNVIAMKIMDIMGIGGSFSEFYALDLNDDIVLLGHDGPGHAQISEGKVKLVPLPVFHGKPGKGLSIQMSVKHGPVTLLSVVQEQDGKIKLLVAEGESVPGPILNIGNTNSRYRFSLGAKEFFKEWSEQGPAHHMAIGIGHVAGKIEKLAKILELKYKKID